MRLKLALKGGSLPVALCSSFSDTTTLFDWSKMSTCVLGSLMIMVTPELSIEKTETSSIGFVVYSVINVAMPITGLDMKFVIE